MHSLQARLSLGLLIGLVVVFVVQWYVAHRALEYLLIRYVTAHLEQDAETVLAALREDATQGLRPDATRVDARYQRPFSGQYYLIRVGAHSIQSRSLWDFSLTIPAVAPGESINSVVDGPEKQELLLVVRGFSKFDRDVVIAVARDIEALRSDVAMFQWRFAGLAVALLIVLIALHMVWVRRGLSPLKTIQRELDALEAGTVKRLTVELAPSEVQPLVRQVNRLVGLILSRMERSRHALGNLAHALKTPLTALTQQIEQPEIAAHPELQRQLRRYTATVQDLIERELKRARVAGAAVPTQRYDLAAEIESLLQTLRMVHRAKNVAIESILQTTSACALDREDLFELLGNLLDNACKWSRARVRLTVKFDGDWMFIIEDDGPGVPPEEFGRIAERGIRIDEHTAGHGLGLSIVKDLLDTYHGSIEFDASPDLGGFRVRARVPDQTR